MELVNFILQYIPLDYVLIIGGLKEVWFIRLIM